MTKAALFAGAATLALAATSHAQSSDALIDKLVDKGILTTKEAQDLRADSDNDFKTALQAKTGMPDWVNSYSLNGSVRGRFEQFSALHSESPLAIDRTRMRYRILVGLKVNMLDDLEAGFRLGSGDVKGSAGNPLSQNSTMQDNFSDKGVYIDLAYGKWTPIHNSDWQVSGIVGKMENPFLFTPMVFDQDLTPEGAAIQGNYNINDKHSIAFTGATFVLDEEGGSTHDPFMYGGQITWNAKWTPKWSSSLGIGAFGIGSPNQLTSANVTEINQGNSRSAGGILLYDYNPIIADASVTYTLESFPLYAGAFPIKLQAEGMNNPAGPSDSNSAYWLGVQLGKSGTKGTWDLSYRYEYLEANAWYDQMVDDDNVGFYQAKSDANGSTGYVGGTNVRGHLIKFNYSFRDSLTFTATCFLNDLINATGEPKSAAMHFMADVMWKF